MSEYKQSGEPEIGLDKAHGRQENGYPRVYHEQVQPPNVESTSGSEEKESGDRNPSALSGSRQYEQTKLVSDFLREGTVDLRSGPDLENELNRRLTVEYEHQKVSLDQQLDREIRRTQTLISGVVPTEVDPLDLEWDGPDDPDNPWNFASWKKACYTMAVALTGLACTLGSSLYVGAVPQIMLHFRTSQIAAIAGLPMYIVGLALGPMIGAPLSERIGRRPVYLLSAPLGILFTMGVGLSHNIGSVLVLRFFAGFFASPSLSVAAGTVTDLFGNDPFRSSVAIGQFAFYPFLGPVLGPVIAPFASQNRGWQWAAAWIWIMISGLCFIMILFVPETYKIIILKNRAKKRGIKIKTVKKDRHYYGELLDHIFVKPIKMLFLDPIVFWLTAHMSFLFAILFGFFEAFPFIFRTIYNFSFGISGLTFLSVGLGLVIGLSFYTLLDLMKYYPKQPNGSRIKLGPDGKGMWFTPESRLLICVVGSVFIPISLFWLGWTGRRSVHWMAPAAAGVPFGFGLICVFLGVMMYYNMSFPPAHVASAAAANNFLRYGLAAAFPFFTTQMFVTLGVGWASTLLGIIAAALVMVPIIFSRFGASFRARSRWGYQAYVRELTERMHEQPTAA